MCAIKKTCEAFLSELGHKNFLYPSKKKIVLEKGIFASRISWVGMDGLVPVKIETRKIFDLYQSRSHKKYSVVWIKKECIDSELGISKL